MPFPVCPGAVNCEQKQRRKKATTSPFFCSLLTRPDCIWAVMRDFGLQTALRLPFVLTWSYDGCMHTWMVESRSSLGTASFDVRSCAPPGSLSLSGNVRYAIANFFSFEVAQIQGRISGLAFAQ